MNEREQRLQRQLETAHSALNKECATVAALRQQLAAQAAELERLLPILTAHLASREEEYARLREAAERVLPLAQQTVAAQAGAEWMNTTEDDFGVKHGPYPSDKLEQMRADVELLRAALTPQQEQGQ